MNGYAELIEGWRDKCRAAESERDALRAEVERLRRAVKIAASAAWDGDPHRTQEIDLAVQQAIVEAGKGER